MGIEKGYSLCLNEWALDKSIKNELNLLVIISSLTAKKGYCYASNQWFANLFDIDETSVSRKLKKLEQAGYINILYKKRGFEVVDREIRLAKMQSDDLQKCESSISKNANRPLAKMQSDDLQKCESSISKNAKYNITSNKITSNKITNPNNGEGGNLVENNTKILEKNNKKIDGGGGSAPRGIVVPKISIEDRLPQQLRAVVAQWAKYPETKQALIDYIAFLIDTYGLSPASIKEKIRKIVKMASNSPKGIEIICHYNIDRNYASPYKPSDYKKQMAQSEVISEEFTGEFCLDENGEIEEV